MKKGFTLLELIVVIIIIGILATLGFSQYAKVVEKGRTAEAKAILGQIRTAQAAYYLERNTFANSISDLAVGAPSACAATHYFNYSTLGDNTTYNATATRCTGSGKTPNGPEYTITVDAADNWGGSVAGYY